MAPLLTLQDIHLTFGGTPLLEGAVLSIGERERVCLVGRNGSGKSTLLKIAAGLAEADHGVRFVQPGATIRYLPQEPDLTGYPNVLGFVAAGLATGVFSKSCRARPCGSIGASRGGSSAVFRRSRSGAIRCWKKRSESNTSLVARLSPRNTGCATA